ncbi:hypothetical protein X743_23265 [Mesorhizobium sp. LNHC252B00]|nr:hypothetical protein X743_23265 [Mesorhizobium sp. LNHC252B00]
MLRGFFWRPRNRALRQVGIIGLFKAGVRRTVTAGGYCHIAAGDDQRTVDRNPLAIPGGCTKATRRTDREPCGGNAWHSRRL